MPSLIDRYVYDVIRRLPEKEREEVKRELYANIWDMLGDDEGDEAVRAVLLEMGAPAALAARYSQRPAYLISPAVYGDYVRALKWVVPLVAVLGLTVGLVVGGIQAVEAAGGMADAVDFLRGALERGVGAAFSAGLWALLWVTVGFAVAERAGYKSGATWKPEDLPQEVPADKYRIPLSDSIVELVVTVVFTTLLVLVCLRALPGLAVAGSGTAAMPLFSDSFVTVLAPVLLVMMALDVGECVIKMVYRRWTPVVCLAVVLNNLACMAMVTWLLGRPDIFSGAFSAWAAGRQWGQFDLLRFMGQAHNPVLMVLGGIIVVVCLGNCASAVYRTVRARQAGGPAAFAPGRASG